MIGDQSDEQLLRRGLEVLYRELGPAGLIRFLQQFETGERDYSVERYKWLSEHPLDDLLSELKRKGGPDR
jgi:hypothetical protein